jgi:hypothetical protein
VRAILSSPRQADTGPSATAHAAANSACPCTSPRQSQSEYNSARAAGRASDALLHRCTCCNSVGPSVPIQTVVPMAPPHAPRADPPPGRGRFGRSRRRTRGRPGHGPWTPLHARVESRVGAAALPCGVSTPRNGARRSSAAAHYISATPGNQTTSGVGGNPRGLHCRGPAASRATCDACVSACPRVAEAWQPWFGPGVRPTGITLAGIYVH